MILLLILKFGLNGYIKLWYMFTWFEKIFGFRYEFNIGNITYFSKYGVNTYKLCILAALLSLLIVVPASLDAYTNEDPFVTIWRVIYDDLVIAIPVGGITGSYIVDISGDFKRIYLNGQDNAIAIVSFLILIIYNIVVFSDVYDDKQYQSLSADQNLDTATNLLAPLQMAHAAEETSALYDLQTRYSWSLANMPANGDQSQVTASDDGVKYGNVPGTSMSKADPTQIMPDGGIVEKFDVPFYNTIQKLAAQEPQRSGLRSDALYYDVVITVARHDAHGNDISAEQKEIVVEKLNDIGARDIVTSKNLLFVLASIPVGAILDFSLHDEVYGLGDGQIRGNLTINTSRMTVNAEQVDLIEPDGTTLDVSDVIVAVIDSGITHPTVNEAVIGRATCPSDSPCYETDSVYGAPDSGTTHGSMVAHVIGGRNHTSGLGIASGVSLLDAHFIDLNISSLYSALDWAISKGADVANISISYGLCGDASSTGNLIVNDAVNQGIVIAKSAGNYGSFGYILSPGCASNLLTVGGINDRGTNIVMYGQSSKGPYYSNGHPILKPDIVAPGYKINLVHNDDKTKTRPVSGTSFSSPHVAAAAAMLIGKDETMQANEVKAALLLGANWTGPIPCTSVQYERYTIDDNCSHARQPNKYSVANNHSSLKILNNVGFGILDVRRSLEYISQEGSSHVIAGNISNGEIIRYAFNITDTAEPVKTLLTWMKHSPAIRDFNTISISDTSYPSNLDLVVICPGIGVMDAGSDYQNNEFAVFMPNQTGTCIVDVTASSIDLHVTSQEYVIASTHPLVPVNIAPIITSIERFDPESEVTSSQSLLFRANFNYPVTGVDLDDFTLSPDSTMESKQFTQTREVLLPIPDEGAAIHDTIAVADSGDILSVSVGVDITHTHIGNLMVDLLAPDGTIVNLHERTGGGSDDINQTYEPAFDGAGLAGDWVLRVRDMSDQEIGTLNEWTLTIEYEKSVDAVIGLTGSGSQYFVSVLALRDGTYNLDIVSDSGIIYVADNPLNGTDLADSDHSYVVETGSPEVVSIKRSDQIIRPANYHSLVFGVNFSEPVRGVDAADFVLSPDDGRALRNFTQTMTPSLPIPDNGAAVFDAVTISSSGTVRSVSVDVDISHTYISDLSVALIAPDGTIALLHNRAGASSHDIHQTYTPNLADISLKGNWTLRMNDAGPADVGTLNEWTLSIEYDEADSTLTGAGSRYLVTVPAVQSGTYNLDIVPNSGISDLAGNPLAGDDPSVDQSFNVTITDPAPVLAAIPDQTVDELSTVTFTAGVTNGDLLSGPLAYELDSGPNGASMDPATGVFKWTPTETQNGIHAITVTVADLDGRTDLQDVKVIVNEVNTAPVLDAIANQTVDTRSVLTFMASATDGDRHPGVAVETVARNLRIPWSIDWTPDGTALFTEREGNLRMIRDGVLSPDPLLSLNVSSVEGGLLGIAVDPDFEENSYVYLYYSVRGADNSVTNKVVRYLHVNGTVAEDRILIDGIPGASYHDGGRIQFGPDGNLYVATGDAGTPNLAQDLDSLAGKILRIDRDGAIPEDNPFTNSTIWSLGHRNPQGMDWDGSGNLVAAEHGPSGERGEAHDEINLIVPGANYGWPDIIGGETKGGMQVPILHTGNDTWAPSGAEFYDGDTIPGWTGKYFVAALRGTHLHMVDLDLQNNAVISHEKLFEGEFGRLRDVQTGHDGFLYLLTSNRDGRGSPVPADDRILRVVSSYDDGSSRPANTLTYGLEASPAGASMDPATGTFTWRPAEDQNGIHTITVTVSDGNGGTNSQEVQVTVNVVNVAPIVDASSDPTALEGQTVMLNGTATDADGDSLTYLWSHNSSLAIQLANSTSPSTTFAAPAVDADTAVTFTLTVDDGIGISSDQVTITIDHNDLPTVKAGADQTVQEGQTVTLNGTAADNDGDQLTYRWSHDSTLPIVFANDASLSTTFAAPAVDADTAVTFTLTVDDGIGISSDQVTITIDHNDLPTVKAGADQTVQEGQTVTLNGTAADNDGDQLTYRWSHDSTLPIVFANDASLSTTFAAPAVDADTAVTFTLTVDDGIGISSDQVTITIYHNDLPTVKAGADQTVQEGQTVTLNGTAADNDGDHMTYRWSHDSTLPIVFANDASLSTTFAAPAVDADTAVTFTLTVDDGIGISSDQVTITIDHNDLPTVKAGADQTVQEGQTVTLNGTAADNDGDHMTYRWSHDSTLPIVFANDASLSTTFAAPAVDADTAVTFTLTVDDGIGISSDQVTITIDHNDLPTVKAGADQTVQEGQTVTLNGTAADNDGDHMTYRWSHDSTLPIVFANDASLSTTFAAPAVDADTEITFTLTVDDGLTDSTDTVLVTVNDVPDDSDFVTTWETMQQGESITIPARGTYTIDWGDGTVDARVTRDQTHTYADPGNHTVRISKDITGIYLNNHADAPKLRSIDQWGDAEWRSMYSSFMGASNMVLHATDAPDLSRVTYTSYMFLNASSFDGDLSAWDLSHVTSMTGMFWGASSFDGDLSAWDVSSVTDMYTMFYNAISFDGDISTWDVSRVRNMANMFHSASSFDGDISTWDVSSVTDMYAMFLTASSFNGDISGWDVSRVTDMVDMFHSASSFNGDISGWDVSSTTRMNNMFYSADSFDQNMGPWYIVLDDAVIDRGSVPGDVGRIAAQNAFLDSQNPAYGIGSGGDSDYFEIDGSILKIKSVPDGHAGPYSVTITSAGIYGSENSHTFEISVTDGDDNTSSVTPSDPRSVGEIILSSTLPGTIQIDWNAPGEEPREYRITWAKSGEEFPNWRDPVGNAFPTGSSYTITGLDEDEEYQVKVRARYDSGGPGPWGDISVITVAGSG